MARLDSVATHGVRARHGKTAGWEDSVGTHRVDGQAWKDSVGPQNSELESIINPVFSVFFFLFGGML